MALRVAPNSGFENLRGSYKNEIGPGGYPLDGVSFVSKRRAVQPPNGPVPGPDAPVPTTTAKPNKQTNVAIPYTRTAAHSISNGDVVLVERVSENRRGNPSFGCRVGSHLGSACRVFTLDFVNREMDDESHRLPAVNAFRSDSAHPANSFRPDGILISSENGITSDSFTLSNTPYAAKEPTFAQNNYPALAVAVQGPALMLNEKKMLPSRGITQTVNPKSPCGAVVYVGLFCVPADAQFKMEFRLFTSVEIRGGLVLASASTLLASAWRLGTVMDSNAAPGPGAHMIRVNVDINPIGPLDVIDPVMVGAPPVECVRFIFDPDKGYGKNLMHYYGRSARYRQAVDSISTSIQSSADPDAANVPTSQLSAITDMGAGDHVVYNGRMFTPSKRSQPAHEILEERWK